MPLPKSVTKVDRKGGVSFTSNVDRVNYTIQELVRAAQRDTAKLIRKRMLVKLRKLRGFKRGKLGRLGSSTQYWVRRREGDLQIGFKHDTWYGARSELGTHGSPARNILRGTVLESIPDIRDIQAKYLSAVSNEKPSLSGTSEDDYVSPDGEEL